MTEIELTERQAERIEAVREQCTDEHTPPPSDEVVMQALLDTWDAVDSGSYPGVDL